MSDNSYQPPPCLGQTGNKQHHAPVPPSLRRCHIYPGTMPDIIQFSEHSELCETVAIRHKCKECIKSYSYETKRLYRAKKAAEKIKNTTCSKQ